MTTIAIPLSVGALDRVFADDGASTALERAALEGVFIDGLLAVDVDLGLDFDLDVEVGLVLA